MELHRIKSLKEDFPEDLFNSIYKEVQPLKYAIARSIDYRRLGVTKDIVESWLDDKILYAFNKYFDTKTEPLLKGYVLQSLQTFKYRILRKAYQVDIYDNLVELEGEKELINIIPDKNELDDSELFLGLARSFMENALSRDALEIYNIQLNPPPYILKRMKNPNSRIPIRLLAEYLSLGSYRENLEYLSQLREEVNEAIKQARAYFKDNLTTQEEFAPEV